MVAFSQITTKNASFDLNVAVNLTTGASTTSKATSSVGYGKVYSCSTVIDNNDLFINYYNSSTCTCPCPSASVGSARPIYVPKKQLTGTILSSPLRLNDTALFTKVDTIRNDPNTKECVLPYIVIHGASDIIVTTFNGKYVLAHFNPIIISHECIDFSSGTSYHWNQSLLTGFTITWFIQNNLQPLFPVDIPSGVVKNPDLHIQKTTPERVELYSLQGRKISSLEAMRKTESANKISSLYVITSRGNTHLIVR
jgi:hypothetical protein